MKKAVITSGGKQYLVAENDELEVELLNLQKTADFDVLLLIDGDKTFLGAPKLDKAEVKADILEAEVKDDKVTAIRYKAKKRVHKRRGHRQRRTRVKIKSISVKS